MTVAGGEKLLHSEKKGSFFFMLNQVNNLKFGNQKGY